MVYSPRVPGGDNLNVSAMYFDKIQKDDEEAKKEEATYLDKLIAHVMIVVFSVVIPFFTLPWPTWEIFACISIVVLEVAYNFIPAQQKESEPPPTPSLSPRRVRPHGRRARLSLHMQYMN